MTVALRVSDTLCPGSQEIFGNLALGIAQLGHASPARADAPGIPGKFLGFPKTSTSVVRWPAAWEQRSTLA